VTSKSAHGNLFLFHIIFVTNIYVSMLYIISQLVSVLSGHQVKCLHSRSTLLLFSITLANAYNIECHTFYLEKTPNQISYKSVELFSNLVHSDRWKDGQTYITLPFLFNCLNVAQRTILKKWRQCSHLLGSCMAMEDVKFTKTHFQNDFPFLLCGSLKYFYT
jgi:hypothetical protein